MDETPNLVLPYLAPAQAQKHVTVNESLRKLDALVQIAVVDRDLTDPPGAPDEGARYVVAGAATGAWAGQEGRIAAFQDGAWLFYDPRPGWIAWVEDEGQVLAWDGAAWVSATAEQVSLLGVNTSADASNRLAVASPAVLFTHEGAGAQAKINKAAAADTASLLFQTGFSGRAEFGLAGDDDFHIKVSADGAAWTEALTIDRASGAVKAALVEFSVNNAQSIMQRNAAGTQWLALPYIDSSDRVRTQNPVLMSMGAEDPVGGAGLAVSVTTLTAGKRLCSASHNNAVTGGAIAYQGVLNTSGTGENYLQQNGAGRLQHRLVTLGAGDLQTTYVVNGVTTWSLGLDNSDSDRFKIAPSSALEVNTAITIDPASRQTAFGVAPKLPSATVAGAPSASSLGAGAVIYVSDETGGATLAFSDGTDWRRVQDRAVISA